MDSDGFLSSAFNALPVSERPWVCMTCADRFADVFQLNCHRDTVHPDPEDLTFNNSAVKLNEVMDFDHVVEVHPDGSVTDGPAGIYAPEISWEEQDVTPQGWSLLNGYSGQFWYSGPIMHPSEYIGGRMEWDILAEPGVYVALVVDSYPEGVEESEPVGWAVAKRL